MAARPPGRFRLDIKLVCSGQIDWPQIAKWMIILLVVALTIAFGRNLPPLGQLFS